jgi:UDP-N-acetylmuramyl pentapeptide phosphotransferase/UDP-N-acetylglucosamine-1-phosphate transferase
MLLRQKNLALGLIGILTFLLAYLLASLLAFLRFIFKPSRVRLGDWFFIFCR